MVFNKAKWIWNYKSDKKNEYNDFIQEFKIQNLSEKCFINICSDTNYEIYVNGIIVGFNQYHDFPEEKHYDNIDITDKIKTGDNKLAIIGYSQFENTQAYVSGCHGIIFEVIQGNEIIASSSENTLSRISLDYYNGEMYKFTGQLGYSYKYFANKYDNWIAEKSKIIGFTKSYEINYNPKYSIRPINKLVLVNDCKSKIITQGLFKYPETYANVAYAMQTAYLSQRELKTLCNLDYKVELPFNDGIKFKNNNNEGIYLIIDLGKETAGSFSIKIETDKETKIDVGYGEHLEDLRCRTEISERCFAFEITTKVGLTKYNNYIKRIGARYLQLFIHSNDFTLYNATVISTNYPLNYISYETDNYLRKKIYEVSQSTLQLCMHEHYEDCPWREQALYAFDSRNQMLFGYFAFNEQKMPRASLVLLGKSLRSDGLLELCAPCRMDMTIPMFSVVYLLQVEDYINYTKDYSILEEVYDACESIIKTTLKNRASNGLIKNFTEPKYWNFYEWSDGLDGMPLDRNYIIEESFDMILNCFAVCALKSISTFAKSSEEKKQYLNDSETLSNIIDKEFWDNDKTCYSSYIKNNVKTHYSQFANSMALYSEIGNKVHLNLIADRLINNSIDMNKCTLSVMFYKFEGLLKLDRKKYLDLILKEIDKEWGKMLFNNATSFYETELGADDFYFAGSLCHGWSALPIYFYKKYFSEV